MPTTRAATPIWILRMTSTVFLLLREPPVATPMSGRSRRVPRKRSRSAHAAVRTGPLPGRAQGDTVAGEGDDAIRDSWSAAGSRRNDAAEPRRGAPAEAARAPAPTCEPGGVERPPDRTASGRATAG